MKYDKLKQDGIAHGMCEKFQKEWQNPDLKKLMDFFFRGMDFCIEHNWPSMSLAREIFDADELVDYGVFIKDGEAHYKRNICVLDNAEVHVYIPDGGLCDVYARHHSKVHLHLGLNSFCYVSAYDSARIFVEEKADSARLCASKFGGHILNSDMFDVIHNKTKEG